MNAVVLEIQIFQKWLHANGFSYLEQGVGDMPPGDALLEIARRGGVRGLKGSDSIVETLPMVMDIIRLKCRPAV